MNRKPDLIKKMKTTARHLFTDALVSLGCFAAIAALVFMTQAAWALNVNALPTGGRIVAGSGSIAQSGSAMTVHQQTDKMIANWNTFNIGQNASVAFRQPGASSVALNRILDQNPSRIFGSLSANGQIFLVNPAGIYFSPTATVDVGGLVASSLNLSNENFLAGKYLFEKAGTAGSIHSQGAIRTTDGGYIAFISPAITNEGILTAGNGAVAIAAGDKVNLDFTGDKLVNFTVEKGAIDALIANRGLIQADGGTVLLTAKAADRLTRAVVNNEGVIEARTLANHAGRILLLSDMESGETIVGGTLDASAPDGGDGGFIETSGRKVTVADNLSVTTFAPYGETGAWLIDPTDFIVAASGGDMTGAEATTALATSNLELRSAAGATGTNGDIFVNDSITWSANKLTLNAYRNITINSELFGSGMAQLSLLYGQESVAAGNTATYTVNAPVNLPAGNNFFTTFGSDGAQKSYTVITSLGSAGSATATDLQGMSGNLAGNYALGANIDATATSGWNVDEGFSPIGNSTTYFTGAFDGLGHTISDLFIDRLLTDSLGLFGYIGSGAKVSNVGMAGGSVTGGSCVGGLAGYNKGGTITDSYATGNVTGNTKVGGLAGYNNGGTVTNSYATGSVTGGLDVGGLVGLNDTGTVTNSYATGSVTGSNDYVGGLAGSNDNGTITDAYASGSVTGSGDYVGGLVGYNKGPVTNSYATGSVTGSGDYVGGLVGCKYSGTITDSYATGNVEGNSDVGGLVGYNKGRVTNAYATGNVTGIGDYVGGLAGYNNGTIADSYASGSVNGGPAIWYVGGLAGQNDGTITDSYATGSVNGGLASWWYVGGLVGWNYGTITNAYATGSVTGDDSVGGLAGYNKGSVTSSYATGSVEGNSDVGGLVGYNDAGTITGSYWDTQTSGQLTSSGGTGLSTAQMMQLATFSTGWDIDDEGGTGKTWRIYEGNTYPLLRHFLTAATATVDNASMGYNGSTTVAGGSHTWDIAVDAAKIFGVAAYTSASKNVGAQAVTLTGLYSNQQGYDIKTVDGTVDIAKAVLTITAQTNTKVYDAETTAAATPTVKGLQGADTVTGLAETYDNKNAGTGKTLSVSSSYTVNDGNSGNNYTVATLNDTTGVITKKDLTASYMGSNKVYDATTTAAVTGSSTDIIAGDAVTFSQSASFTDKNAGAGKTINITGIGLGGIDAGNYNLLSAIATTAANISKKALTGSIAEGTSSYGSALNPGAVILTNKVEGDVLTTTASVNTTGNTSTSGNLKAGSYNGIEYISALEGADAGNYTFADIEGDYTVSQLALTGTAIASGTSTYGSALNPGAVSFWNVVGTDVVTSTAAVDTGATSTSGNYVAGTYTQTASAIDGADASNYSFGGFTSAANYTITARSLTAAYTGTNKFYDATTAATATGSSNDIIAGDAVTFSQTAAFADKNVATGKTVSVSGIALSGADAANYSLTGTTATTTADINPAALTVTAKDDHKIYSGVGYSGGNGVTYDGFVGGETSAVLGGALTYGGTSQGAVHTGTYGIDPQGLTSGNYDVSFVGGVLTIVRSQTILIDIYAALMSTKEILSIPPTAGSATLANLAATTLIKDKTEGK